MELKGQLKLTQTEKTLLENAARELDYAAYAFNVDGDVDLKKRGDKCEASYELILKLLLIIS